MVYASAMAAELFQPTKWEVEQHLAASGLPYTVLRPSSFMENYLNPALGVRDGALRTGIAPHVRQQLIALDDIAAMAGDALTPVEAAAAISAATGVEVPYEQVPIEEIRRVNPRFAEGYEYLNKTPEPTVDIATLRTLHPGLKNFDQWLDQLGSVQFKAVLGAPKPVLRQS